MDAVKQSYDIPKFKEQYENFIGGEWVAPKSGEYFDNISPVDGKPFTKVARYTAEDIELALDGPQGRSRVEQFVGDNAQQPFVEDRPKDGRESRPAGTRRDMGQRQTDPRDDVRRYAARDRPFSLFCRRYSCGRGR